MLCIICCSFGCYAQFVLKFPKDRFSWAFCCQSGLNHCTSLPPWFAGPDLHWCLCSWILPVLCHGRSYWYVCQRLREFLKWQRLISTAPLRPGHKDLCDVPQSPTPGSCRVEFLRGRSNVQFQGGWRDRLCWCDYAALFARHGNWPQAWAPWVWVMWNLTFILLLCVFFNRTGTP